MEIIDINKVEAHQSIDNNEIKVTVRCGECGDDIETIDAEYSFSSKHHVIIYTKPCETCIHSANTNGYETGYDEGNSEGFSDGSDDGYTRGYDDAKDELEKDNKTAIADAFQAGYDKGYDDCLNEVPR